MARGGPATEAAGQDAGEHGGGGEAYSGEQRRRARPGDEVRRGLGAQERRRAPPGPGGPDSGPTGRGGGERGAGEVAVSDWVRAVAAVTWRLPIGRSEVAGQGGHVRPPGGHVRRCREDEG